MKMILRYSHPKSVFQRRTIVELASQKQKELFEKVCASYCCCTVFQLNLKKKINKHIMQTGCEIRLTQTEQDEK